MRFDNFNSIEQNLLNIIFQSYPLMDLNISKLIESFIYRKITTYYPNGCVEEEYTKRFENCVGDYIIWFDEKDPKNSKSRIFKKSFYIDGKKDGLETTYYLNGQKKREITYTNGIKNGLCCKWYQNGFRESIEYYENNKKQGECTYFYEDQHRSTESETENIQQIANYKDDKLHGLYQLYRLDGSLELEIQYDNGKKNGFWKKYFNTGELKFEINYIDDVYDGEYIEYYTPHVLKTYKKYNFGALIDESFEFFKASRVCSTDCKCRYCGYKEINKKYNYSNILREGDIIGTLYEYSYRNNNVKIIEEWWTSTQLFNIKIESKIYNIVFSSYKQWDEKGLIEIEYEKKNGELNGKLLRYKQGKLIEELMYKDGKLHGESLFYKKDKLQKKELWVNGVIMETNCITIN